MKWSEVKWSKVDSFVIYAAFVFSEVNFTEAIFKDDPYDWPSITFLVSSKFPEN